MKKLVIATAAALALSVGSAFAADLAPVPYYKAPPPPPPPCIWCGFISVEMLAPLSTIIPI